MLSAFMSFLGQSQISMESPYWGCQASCCGWCFSSFQPSWGVDKVSWCKSQPSGIWSVGFGIYKFEKTWILWDILQPLSVKRHHDVHHDISAGVTARPKNNRIRNSQWTWRCSQKTQLNKVYNLASNHSQVHQGIWDIKSSTHTIAVVCFTFVTCEMSKFKASYNYLQ